MTSIIGIAGGLVASYGQYQEGKAAIAAMQYNEKLDAQNAELAVKNSELDAQDAEYQGTLARYASEVSAENIRRKGERTNATVVAAAAASGIDANAGSALSVQMDNARETEIDSFRTLYQGRVDERAKRLEAAKIRYQGQLAAQGYLADKDLTAYSRRVTQRLLPIKVAATALSAGGQSAASYYGRNGSSSSGGGSTSSSTGGGTFGGDAV